VSGGQEGRKEGQEGDMELQKRRARREKDSEGASHRVLEGHDGPVYSALLWSSINYGNILVTGSHDTAVRLWNIDNSVCINTLRGHSDGVVCVAASPNNSLDPLVASGSTDKTIILWALLSGKKVRVLEGHRSVVTDVSIVLDPNPVLVSSSSDSDIICWNLMNGNIIRVLSSHIGPVTSLVTSYAKIPVIVSGGDDWTIKVWDLRSGVLIKSMEGHDSEINVVAVSSDKSNPIVVSGAANGSIFVWDLLGLELIFRLQSARDSYISDKSEISSIAVTSGIFPLIVASSWTPSIHVWDSKSGGLLCVLRGAHIERVCVVASGRDETGPVFISGGQDAVVAIWSPFEDLMSKTILGHHNDRTIADMSLEESLVLAGNYLCCWNLVNQDGITNADCAVFSNIKILILIFYSVIRLGHINPRMIRVKAMALSYLMSKTITHIDLLLHDSLIGTTPLHFLLQNRLCLQHSQQWMKIKSNINKVIYSLVNPNLCAETLDSILRGVICNDDNLSGWEVLLPDKSFTAILSNLMMNSKKSHGSIAVMLKNFGIEPATEPFPVPLTILNPKSKNVVRWHENVVQGRGHYYYRLKINSCLSTDYLLSATFFALIAESNEVNEFVSAPIVEYLIQYKWEKWGSMMTKRLFVFYLVYLFTTTYSVVAICSGKFVDFNSHISYVFFIIFSILCNTVLMSLAFYQCVFTGSYLSYFSNLWNITDAAMLLLCHLSIILGAMLGPTDLVRILSTLFTLLLWGRILYYGRGIEDLAGIVHIMKLVIWDVRYFLLILIIFLCAFAISFHILGVFDSLWLSFFRLFNMMIGNVVFDHSVRGRVITSVLYLTFLVSVAIILLNALIAFMDNSFRLATATKNTAVLVSRLKFLTELEIKSLPFITLFGLQQEEKDLGEVVILLLESEWNSSDLAGQASPLLGNLLSHMDLTKQRGHSFNDEVQYDDDHTRDISAQKRNSFTVNNKIDALESKVRGMENRLDHIIDLLSARSDGAGETRRVPVTESGDQIGENVEVSYSYFGDEDDDANDH
jgi:WD40 repeat protein